MYSLLNDRMSLAISSSSFFFQKKFLAHYILYCISMTYGLVGFNHLLMQVANELHLYLLK